MPGIVGLITRMPREEAESQLLEMMKAIRHESFYETGIWIDESIGVYVGWVALKNSFSDGMPLSSEQGSHVLMFSGEEFPEPGISRRLKDRGHQFEEKGPSYLVHLSEEDPSFPAGLNGRFHGLLVNRMAGTATLFNDRYGMHRINYYQAKDSFYFAAEAKAILRVKPELRRIDSRGLGEIVSCGCVLENRTIFNGMHVLPPGSAWIFRGDALPQKREYFQPQEWMEQAELDPETYYQTLREVFSRNLPRYFTGQQPIGVSVTGGLDTRMIMSWHKASPCTLPCYSFGGTYRESQDVKIGRKVAAACGQPFQLIEVGSEFLDRFPHYVERTIFLTDGCADVTRSSDLFVNERARQIAPVRMTGNYGGEILRALRAFKPAEPTHGLFKPELVACAREARETYSRLVATHPISFSAFRQAPWHHYGLLALEQTQLSLRSPFLDNELVRTIFRAPQKVLTSEQASLRLIADGNAELLRIRTDRGLAGNHGQLFSKMRRQFLEFTFKAEYAYDYGMPQAVSRIDHFFSLLHLERIFLGRHKFYHFRVWYRDKLCNYIREMLLDQRSLSRSYVEANVVTKIINGHMKEGLNYTTAIHKLLTLELIHRLFVDAQ